MDRIIEILARELGKDPRHVENVVRLLDEGSTVPFIARYRKELHGAMDDTALRTLEERLSYLRGLAERREAVKKAIEAQGKQAELLASCPLYQEMRRAHIGAKDWAVSAAGREA